MTNTTAPAALTDTELEAIIEAAHAAGITSVGPEGRAVHAYPFEDAQVVALVEIATAHRARVDLAAPGLYRIAR